MRVSTSCKAISLIIASAAYLSLIVRLHELTTAPFLPPTSSAAFDEDDNDDDGTTTLHFVSVGIDGGGAPDRRRSEKKARAGGRRRRNNVEDRADDVPREARQKKRRRTAKEIRGRLDDDSAPKRTKHSHETVTSGRKKDKKNSLELSDNVYSEFINEVAQSCRDWASPKHRGVVSGSGGELPPHCSYLPPPQTVTIRGERHSGTNLVESLILNNAATIRRIDTHGWKHGVLRPEDDMNGCGKEILLVVARDAFSWLLKMFREPHNMIFDGTGMHEFGPFLRGRYRTQRWNHDSYYRGRGVNCTFPMEEAQNIVRLRTFKYKNWLADDDPPYFSQRAANSAPSVSRHPDLVRSYIRYESLNELGQGRVMETLFRRHCIPHRSPAKEVTSYRGQGGVKKRGYQEHPDDVLSMYTIDELRFVLDNLDLDFEREALDFTYDHVEEHIRRRDTREVQYRGPPRLDRVSLSVRKDLANQFQEGTLDLSPER